MEANDPKHLICSADIEGAKIVGSVEKECAECGCVIFVAPSGQQLLREEPNIIPICTACGIAGVIHAQEASEDVEFSPLTQQANSELLEHGMSQNEIDMLSVLFGIPKEVP